MKLNEILNALKGKELSQENIDSIMLSVDGIKQKVIDQSSKNEEELKGQIEILQGKETKLKEYENKELLGNIKPLVKQGMEEDALVLYNKTNKEFSLDTFKEFIKTKEYLMPEAPKTIIKVETSTKQNTVDTDKKDVSLPTRKPY